MWPKLFALYFPSFNGCKGWKLQKGTQSLGQPNYLAVTIEYRNCRLIRTWSKVKVALWNPNGLYSPWNSPGQNAGLGSLSLLQGNLPNSGIEHRSPALQADSLPAESQGKPSQNISTPYHSLTISQLRIQARESIRDLLVKLFKFKD